MPTAVHYVGGPKDGDNEVLRSRPPETHLVTIGHGYRSVVYWLFLIPVDEQRALFVYAISGMPVDTIATLVRQRLASGEVTMARALPATTLAA
ncbi:hypothetical protein ACFFGH_17225 [Lysobacter korlensis]|uniref:Uncharacterized protein n=1 Tax=Lysobacter korlensis TaxID=553636 RepID=A0ABV6RRI3_9GAMM